MDGATTAATNGARARQSPRAGVVRSHVTRQGRDDSYNNRGNQHAGNNAKHNYLGNRPMWEL